MNVSNKTIGGYYRINLLEFEKDMTFSEEKENTELNIDQINEKYEKGEARTPND